MPVAGRQQFYGCTRFRAGCRGTKNIPVVRAAVVRAAVVGSPEQDAIWDAIVNGTGHVVVNALAGSDIGQGLIALVKRMRAKSVNELLTKLQAWTGKEIAKVAGTRREGTVTQQVTDKANCIYALSENADNVAAAASLPISTRTVWKQAGCSGSCPKSRSNATKHGSSSRK